MSTTAPIRTFQERPFATISGVAFVFLQIALSLTFLAWGWFGGWSEVTNSYNGQPETQVHGWTIAMAVIGLIASNIIISGGYIVLEPNTAAVVQFFGQYKGTVRDMGLRYANPFFSYSRMSVKSASLQTDTLKVNDLDGNPIEFAATVVWHVESPASAVFAVEDYAGYLKIQADAAIRNVASKHAYDGDANGEGGVSSVISLRGHIEQIASELVSEIQDHVKEAGIRIEQARVSHLAYAPEIAQAMLQRQQASAVVAARTQIVAGAVGMVEMAIADLEKKGLVELDPERKAQMVSNLLVVLCSDRAVQPVVNAGSIHG
jgi:regulator of protease activity HflC (stomatin/prohibitin superfamily)